MFLGSNFIYSGLISDSISGFSDLMMVFISQPQKNEHELESENFPSCCP